MPVRSVSTLLLAAFVTAVNAQEVSAPSDASASDALGRIGGADERAQAGLTLDEVLGLAAQSNPALRGARASADASSGALMQAGARPNPQLSLLQEGFSAADRTTTVLVNQTLELGGKRGARLEVASYGRQVALAALDGRAADLRAQVFAAFYGLLAAQRQLQVAQDSAQIAARSADLADKRARAGKVSPVEATKARVAASGVQIEVANAQMGVSNAEEQLATVTGSPEVRGRALAGDLERIPEVGSLPEFLAHIDDAPLTRAARAEMLRAGAAVAVERANRIPDITVSAGMKRVVAGAGAPGNQAVVGISIPLPLFNTNKGAILEAAHQAEKAEADLDSEKAGFRLRVTQAYATYQNAVQQAKRLKTDVLPAARDALDAMSRGYELGKFSFLDVLDAQRTFFMEQSRYVQALTEGQLAYAELGRLIGTPLIAGSFPTTTDRP